MGIKVILKGEKDTPEHIAGTKLQSLFETYSGKANGRVLIETNAKLIGTKVKDVDIIVIGFFDNPRLSMNLRTKAKDNKTFAIDENRLRRTVLISSFCLCIELKSHAPEDVKLNGTKIYVPYSGMDKDVTEQSEAQKYALSDFLKQRTGISPYICNLIWLEQADWSALQRLLGRRAIETSTHNILPSNFTLEEMFELVMMQQAPFSNDRGIYFSASKNFSETALDEIERAFRVFEQVRSGIGKLTRDQMERVTQNILNDQIYAKEIGSKLVLFSGRAGTGKTVKLLRIAIDLASNSNKRCLILTYNHALVSDMRRTLHFIDIPDGIDTHTVNVMTLDKFFFELLKNTQIMSAQGDYLDNRDRFLGELQEYLQTGALSLSDIKKTSPSSVEWDFVLVDEAQDWISIERDILLSLFGGQKLIVADGIDQMVRNHSRCNWTEGIAAYKPPAEKRCLRQKHNLAYFVNSFARQAGTKWQLDPRDDLRGGKIVVISGNYTPDIHNEFFKACKESGNEAYEMMVLIPPSLVEREQHRSASFLDWFQNTEIKFWNGTQRDIRQEYPVDLAEHRLLQYDSCRGLEGWTVVCVWLDDLFSYKVSQYQEQPTEQLTLALMSDEEKAHEYACKWTLMPLTRAIDTLVITLRNQDSKIGRILANLHKELPDIIDWRVP